MSEVRVLLVDDQALLRAGFRLIVEGEPGLVVAGEAGDGLTAVEQAARLAPDVVLILTTFDLDEYVFEALRRGASGFLLKDTPPEELVAAVRVVAGGEALLSPSVTRRLIEEFASAPARTAPRPGVLDKLQLRDRVQAVVLAYEIGLVTPGG